jgi:3-keto-disaccharide hydrolase
MAHTDLTRRGFLGASVLSAASARFATAADDGWVELFNGHSLEGWRPSEHKDSWKVVDGQLAADGPRSHLFYDGPVHSANFKNFELEVEALARPGCNSGVHFHTVYQETNFPQKGFEIQIDNTYVGEGSYREHKKTGSLYGVRNLYKQIVLDDTWFKIYAAVRGKNIQIRINGMLVVDYTEPTPPVIPDGIERERFLDRGTFALQCHNEGSKARFRSVRVRPLPDDIATPGGPPPVVDDLFRKIINEGRRNVPMVDYHVHLKGGLTLQQALAQSRRDGIQYGIAINCGQGFPTDNDDAARKYVDSMQGQPIFIAMQAEGREWTKMFSRRAAGLFDYIFTDSMTWTDNRGRRMRTWIPEEVGTITDPQEFMETLVDRAVGILEHEPVDIYANPTFLPQQIAADYDRLWTEARMQKVAQAAAANHVAIELNTRYSLPSAAFVRVAKAAGCKFSFGTNNTGPDDLKRCEHGFRMIDECKLVWQDFFVPGELWPKAIERKGEALRA